MTGLDAIEPMEHYCINHPNERAVGLCGTCQRPACYQCSLTIDQVIYCSPECFNELDPPSSSSRPPAPAPTLTDLSDVVSALDRREHAAPPAAGTLGSEPSVILTPQLSDQSDAAIDGRNPFSSRRRDESTLVKPPGSGRSVVSSSCFFHPDTSAIVLCANCRNPICSLCAKEVPAGLVCSPSCGPLDRAGDRERRRLVIRKAALISAVVLVLIESLVLLRGVRMETAIAAARSDPGTADRDPDPTRLDPELRQAAALMREAESLLLEAADAADPGRRASIAPPALKAKVGSVAGKLRQAREIYQARMDASADPAALKSRIETITGLLDGLRSSDDPGPEQPPK
ncbi:MAG TPA: B-box zinc finger protein [Planctomycetota bacterium]|nr:B-box zinc finger protein [Planctomycetota bacterium]